MKRLVVSAYRFREHLGETELGTIPGVIAHYARLDGRGGFMIEEVSEDPEQSFELTLRYAPWVEFEVFPVTTIEDAFPVMQRVYG